MSWSVCLVVLVLGVVDIAQCRIYCDDNQKRCPTWAAEGKCKMEPDRYNKMCGVSCRFQTLVLDDGDYLHDICATGWSDQGRETFMRHNEMNKKQPTRMPAFTDIGFKHMKIPKDVYAKILEERQDSPWEKEQNLPGVIDDTTGSKRTFIMKLSDELNNEIINTVRPILEEWIGGQELEHTYLFYMRRYLDGHQLHMHVDSLDTHVISAILNIAQKVDEDWLLYILDHDRKVHKIKMAAGDMVLYESAKAVHGRPEPLKGKYYDNIFVHYRPYEWEFASVQSGTIIPGKDEL